MRIYGASGTPAPIAGSPAKRGTSGTFSVPSEESTTSSAPVGVLRTVGGIDALIALQGIEDPAERRRRSFGRGKNALDALDELKIGLLAGTLDASALGRLKSAATGLRDSSGDDRLDSVLAEIEVRVEVELAKLDPRA